MSATQKEKIDLVFNWGGKIIFGVASFLLVSFAYDLKTDVRTVLFEQQAMKEKVRRIERVIDKIEDGGIKTKE